MRRAPLASPERAQRAKARQAPDRVRKGAPVCPPNHRLAGPGRDVATAVEHARTAPRTTLPDLPALARERALPVGLLEVRIGGPATDACAWLGARAFAVQNILVFAEARPDPCLVRHELAHVAQQEGAIHPAPAHYASGSLGLGDPAGAAEREAHEGGGTGLRAPVAVYRETGDDLAAPDADQDAKVDDTVEPSPTSPEWRVRFKTALKRLQALADKQELIQFDPKVDDETATRFGVSIGGTGDTEQFDPVFWVSSKTPWTLEDYSGAQTEMVSPAAAKKDLSAHIFRRAPPSDSEPRALDEAAIARRAFGTKHGPLWAARVISAGQPVESKTDAISQRYVFVGRYFKEGGNAAGNAVSVNQVSVAGDLGSGKIAGIVSDKYGKTRKPTDPDDSLNAYATIVAKLVDSSPAERKEDRKTSSAVPLDAIARGRTAADKDAAAKTARDALIKWVLEKFTTIDEFFKEIVTVSGFPKGWNPIKGEIQARYLANLGNQQLGGGSVEARQVYLGVLGDKNNLLKPTGFGARRQGDGYIQVGATYHILESKARQGPPSDEEFEQMGDYRIVIADGISGYLSENKEFKLLTVKFSAVEYYIGIAGEVVRDPKNKNYELAESWNAHLYRAFKKLAKNSTDPIPPGKAGEFSQYRIHPNVTGESAKSTTIRINPLVTLPIPDPGKIDQSITDAPSAKTPGAKVLKAEFKLARAFEAEIASGSITIALDLGGAVKSPDDPKPKPMKPIPAADAKPAKPGGPVVYGQVENRFDKLGSSLDKFFRERITTDAKLTDNGVTASVTVSRGPSGIPGIALDEASIALTYGAQGLTARGEVGLSNAKGTVKGGLAVTWNSTAKEWKVAGHATFTNLIDGLEPIKATLTYDPANDVTTIQAERVAIKKTYGAITLTGAATNLKFDAKTGMFSGDASIKAALGAFGDATAESRIADNRITSAALTYKTPRLAFPKASPVLAGDLTGTVTYTAGQAPGDAPTFSGDIAVDAEIHAGALKRLAKDGRLGVAGKIHIADSGAFSGSIGTSDPLTLGEHFRIPPFQATVKEDGAFELAFALEVVNIAALKDARVTALINDKGFEITGANVRVAFGSDKDKVWGGLAILYKKGPKGGELTVGGGINVRIAEGLVAHGDATYDVDKETVSATLSIDEITLLKYGPKEHTIFDFSKQVELISFYKVIGIYLDAGFSLTFSYTFDLRLAPKVTLKDFSFRTFAFSSATATMKLLGEMAAELTGTPKIGLGLFVVSTKLLRGGGGLMLPVKGRAALALDPPMTVVVTYTPDGGVSAGGTAGLSLLFGVSAAIEPYADFDVLGGAYHYDWKGQPLATFELLKERPIFTYVVNFGAPLTTETDPKFPTGQDAPVRPGGEKTLVGKQTSAEKATKPATDMPVKEQTPEKKAEAGTEGGFDLGGLVSKVLGDKGFSPFKTLLDTAGEVWDALTNFVGHIVKFIRNWIGGAIDVITRTIKGIGQKGLIGYIKDLLKERLNPALFYIIEPLLDELATVEQDFYDLLDIKLPTSFSGLLDFAVDIIKKVMKLAWDSLGGLVKALYKMIGRMIEATRKFAQLLVDTGRLGVERHERYIGVEGVAEHDFLLADRYKIIFAGLNIEEQDDTAWPSVDKAIGWGLWHLLDELGVEPTSKRINQDTGEPYNDYWTYNVQRQVRGAGRVSPQAPAAVRSAEQEPGEPLAPALRRYYEAGLSADLADVRLHTSPASDAAARALDACAFTAGRDVHFAAGAYAPGTPEGDALLAHELAHVAAGPCAPRQPHGFQVEPAGGPGERWANAVADRLAR